MNPKGLVVSHEGIHVLGHSHIRAGGAGGFGMIHDGVEVLTGEVPLAEGALEDVSLEVEVLVVFARLQPPQDLTSLRVEVLVVAANVTVRNLLHSNIRI